MGKTKKSLSVVVLILFLVVFQGSRSVLADPNIADLTTLSRFEQEQSNWCWAACAKMVGHYYGYTSTSQSSIVYGTLGNIANNTASDSQVVTALSYALSASKTVTNVNGTKYLNQIKNNILNGNPSVLKIHWNSGGNHDVVCRGFISSSLVIVDPGAGCSSIETYEYSDLISGVTILSGTGTYINTFWIQ